MESICKECKLNDDCTMKFCEFLEICCGYWTEDRQKCLESCVCKYGV